MTTKEIFAQRLCEIRESKNLTRQRVADDLGITRASLEYYEKGKRTPDINTINEIANYFSVSVDYLFGRTECISKNDEMRTVCDFYKTDINTACAVRNLFEKNKNYSEDFKGIITAFDFQVMLYHIYKSKRLKSDVACFLLDKLNELSEYLEMSPKELYDEFGENGCGLNYMYDYEEKQKEIDLNEYRTQKSALALINLNSKEYSCNKWQSDEEYIHQCIPTQEFINKLIVEIESCIDCINHGIRKYVDQQKAGEP